MQIVFNTGGTNTRVAVSTDGKSLSEVKTMETNEDPQLWIEDMVKAGAELTHGKKPTSVCGGIAGVWDENKNKLLRSPNLTSFERVPLKKKLTEAFGVEVALDNDVVMEGLGEATMGAGRRKQIVAHMTIGTGIGGVKIENGKVAMNAWGFEPGHQILEEEGGEVGYLESFASGAAMERIYGKKPDEIDDPEIWDHETRLIAIGINNLIVFWSPEIVILGGGLMNKIKLEDVKRHLAAQLKIFPKYADIQLSQLGEKSGLYGALVYTNKNREDY